MEHTKHNWDSASKKVLNEAGLHKAPANFMPNIMEAIAKAGLEHIKYRPLISKKGWFIILMVVTAVLALIVLNVPIERNYLEGVDLSVADKLKEAIGPIEFSKTVLYSIGFLGLFLIQLPFLKRLLDRRGTR